MDRWRTRSFSAATGSSGGGGGDADWDEVMQLSAAATELSEEGRPGEAKDLLKRELPALVERLGPHDKAVGLIHNQLALWSLYDGDYPQAVESSTAARDVWAKELGEDSQAVAFHGIRLGIALAADGQPEKAFPLLEQGLIVAVENYNRQIEQLQGVVPLADENSTIAEASPEDEAIMAVRAEQQRVLTGMVEQLGRALQEAKFYRALSFLGVRGRELNDTWDDKGSGATFFLQQEMSEALTDLLLWVAPDHPSVHTALREHGRLVAQCQSEGLRRISDDLQLHGQRLADVVEEARSGKDG